MNKFLGLICLLMLPFFTTAQSQQKQLDSIHTALKNASNDTLKMVTLEKLANFYAESKRDSSYYYIEGALSLAKKMNQQILYANYLLLKAYIVQKEANFALSLKLCNEALAIVQDKKNEKYIPKDNEYAIEPAKYRKNFSMDVFHQLGNIWASAGNKEKAIEYYKKEIVVADELNSKVGLVNSNMNIGSIYGGMNILDSAMIYSQRAIDNANLTGYKDYEGFILTNIGAIYFKKEQLDSAKYYYQKALSVNKEQNNLAGEVGVNLSLSKLYQKLLRADSMKYYAYSALQLANTLKSATGIGTATNLISDAWKMQGNADSALVYLTISKTLGDSLHKEWSDKVSQFQNSNFENQLQLEKEVQNNIAAKNKIRTVALVIGLGLLSILAFVFYRNNRKKNKMPIPFWKRHCLT